MKKLNKRERAIAQAAANLVTPDGDAMLSENEYTHIARGARDILLKPGTESNERMAQLASIQ